MIKKSVIALTLIYTSSLFSFFNPEQFKELERKDQYRKIFKLVYIADRIFYKMSDSDIEKEISNEPNKAIAIFLYVLATEVKLLKLKPLKELLNINDDLIESIKENTGIEEIQPFICKKIFEKKSSKAIEAEVATISKFNEYAASGIYGLARSCGKNLEDFYKLIKDQNDSV